MVKITLEKTDIYEMAMEFTNKVLFLRIERDIIFDPLQEELKRASLDIFRNISESVGYSNKYLVSGCILKARGRCSSCVSLLSSMRAYGEIGVLTYAALKAEVERISSGLDILIQGIYL